MVKDSLNWPMYSFYCISIFTIPLYLLVLICLLKLRFYSKAYHTTFYTILLQHCIADIVTMVNFIATYCLRTTPSISYYYFKYQEFYIPAWTYNSVYYTLYIRCTGIIFLSIHRYLVISAPHHRLTALVQEAATWKIVFVYWAVPSVISIINMKDTDIHYDSMASMDLVVDKAIITRNTMMALVFVAVTCFICVGLYTAMWALLRKHSAGMTKNLQRELLLAFQVFALLCAFFVMFLYYLFQNYFAQSQNSGPVYVMRSLYPIANGLLSYINPFCILLLNRDFFQQFVKTFKCSSTRVCIADIISMIVFTVIWAIRMLPGLKEFYFNYQEYYIAAGTYTSIYYCLYIRCTGIVFLSIHRYLVISAPTRLITARIQEASPWQIIVIYWVVPTLVSVVVLKDTDFSYNSLEDMEIVAPKEVITRNTLMALIVVALTCFICLVSYLALWMFLRRNSVGISKSLQREKNLAFQVLALLCAFFVMFAYYVLQNYFSRTQNTGPIYTMRALYPIANGILSYINPFCILLLNKDFYEQFKRALKRDTVAVSGLHVSAFHSQSAQKTTLV